MTQRSVLTTAEQTNRSSSCSGERGASYAGKYSFRDRGFGDTLHWRLSCQKRHPWRIGGSAHRVRCPVFGVGRWNGSLLGCLRKDVALCDTASRAGAKEWRDGATGVRKVVIGSFGGDGTFHVHRLGDVVADGS
ncbi:MAG: hypothetical protein P4L69_22590 [Desulfosporosinus sp.]|nr:hypothetical protein [Desulfosporosinus sp.]